MIALQDGASAGDDLVKWAKYHKNATVRLEACLGLIDMGRSNEVEEILKSEQNARVKTSVQQHLI